MSIDCFCCGPSFWETTSNHPIFSSNEIPMLCLHRSSSLASWRLSEEVQSIQCSMAGRPEIVVQRVQRELQVAGGKGCCQVKGWNRCFLTNHVGTYCRYLGFILQGRWGLGVWFWKISLHIPFTMFHIHFSLWGAWNRYATTNHAFIERIDCLGSNLSTFQLHQKELGASVCWPILSNYILYIYIGIVTLQTNWSYGFTVRFCTLWWHFAAKRPFRWSDMILLVQKLEISWAKTTFQVHTRMVPTTPKVLFVSLREGT